MDNVIFYRWQYGLGTLDITGDLYAEQDADLVRAWEGAHGDFCLLELMKTEGGLWEPTGGDGDWLLVADRLFGDPDSALAEYAGGRTLVPAECRCGVPGGECD